MTDDKSREQELAAREAAVAEREAALAAAEAAGPQRSELADDDPLAGTPDDPSVEDPYAHLRDVAKEQGIATEEDAEE